jgi:hypothetical protein
MSKVKKPTPKSQKTISKDLVNPYDKQRGNPNDIVPDENERGLQTSWRDDVTKPFTVGIEDHDGAVLHYLQNIVQPTVTQNGQNLAVPCLYASPEKWKAYQKDGFLRDNKGSLMAPLILILKTGLQKATNITSKVDANFPYNYAVVQRKYSSKEAYSNFAALNRQVPKKQVYVLAVPDYITITYEVVIFAYYIEHCNKIVEAIQYTSDAYWGESSRYKFRARLGDFRFETQMRESEERLVRARATLSLNGYLIPDTPLKETPALNKLYTKSKISFTFENTGSIDQL